MFQQALKLLLAVLLTMGGLLGCAAASPALVLSSLEKGSAISLVPLDEPETSGTRLKNPATVSSAKLKNHFLRVEAPKKIPQYWAVLDGHSKYQVTIKSLSDVSIAENRNRPIRLVLKAYQALTANDLALAREHLNRASELDATLFCRSGA